MIREALVCVLLKYVSVPVVDNTSTEVNMCCSCVDVVTFCLLDRTSKNYQESQCLDAIMSTKIIMNGARCSVHVATTRNVLEWV